MYRDFYNSSLCFVFVVKFSQKLSRIGQTWSLTTPRHFFCFEKQSLKGKEAVKMPVVFYIDPAIAQDPTMENIDTITLSYTFFKYIEK